MIYKVVHTKIDMIVASALPCLSVSQSCPPNALSNGLQWMLTDANDP